MQRLIDKRRAIKHLKELLKNSIMPTEWYEGAKSAITLLQKEQTVDAETVRHGHWIESIMPITGAIEMKCSNCGNPFYMAYRRKFDYCPNCGAKMDEVEDG